jgi:hypothetical protein
MKKEYTKEQPIDGETILMCGHTTKTMHWWKMPHESYFRRPDGTTGTACWIVACDDCQKACGGNGLKIKVTKDGVWNGNEPEIYKYGN